MCIRDRAQLINKDGVAEVQIRRSRIETCLDPQRLTTLELLDQLSLNQNLFRTTLDQRQLLSLIHIWTWYLSGWLLPVP